MNEPKNKLTEEELNLIEETELFMKEVYSDPDVANAEPPADLHDKVFAEIRAREAAKREAEIMEEKRKAEEQELIRLGKIYKKRKGYRKYFVLAAVLVMAMLFGMTSFGEPKKVFERVIGTLTGREQVNIDSDHEDVVKTSDMSEEEAYQKIEELFDIMPVRLNHLPKRIIFFEGTVSKEIQNANLVYGADEKVKITYSIRPNYRTSSIGKDMEDDFIEEYIEKNEYTTITMRRYKVDGVEERWSVQFAYQETLYSLTIMDTSKEEVELIVENLYFP